jgi:hypothetical protein
VTLLVPTRAVCRAGLRSGQAHAQVGAQRAKALPSGFGGAESNGAERERQGCMMALRLCFCRLGLLGSLGVDGCHEPSHEPSFLSYSRVPKSYDSG